MDSLPIELKVMILEQLYLPELGNVAATCKLFHGILRERLVYHRYLRARFSCLGPSTTVTSMADSSATTTNTMAANAMALLGSYNARHYLRIVRMPAMQLTTYARAIAEVWDRPALKEAGGRLGWLKWTMQDTSHPSIPEPVWTLTMLFVVLQSPNIEQLDTTNGGWINDNLIPSLGRAMEIVFKQDYRRCRPPPFQPLHSLTTIHFEKGTWRAGDREFPLINLPSIRNVSIEWHDFKSDFDFELPEDQSNATSVTITGRRPSLKMARGIAGFFHGPCTILAPDFHLVPRWGIYNGWNWRSLRIPYAGAGRRDWRITRDWRTEDGNYGSDSDEEDEEEDEEDDEDEDEDEDDD